LWFIHHAPGHDPFARLASYSEVKTSAGKHGFAIAEPCEGQRRGA
jgi:hypothetical protein